MEVTMRTCLLLLTFFFLLLLSSATHAVTIYVPDDISTIQAGIDACTDGDTVMVRDGTYTGDGNRDIDFLGKAIVVMSENGPEATIIDCEGDSLDPHRGFHIHTGEDSSSVLQGFTIQNGYMRGPYPQNTGGGMLIEDSNPTVINCTFRGNYATYCGGVKNSYSNPTLTNCTFSGNSGGMDNSRSSPTITNCMFNDNLGIGMYNYDSHPTITNCTFSGNSSGLDGGGIYNFNSDPTITNCTFSGNSAGENGGGLYNVNTSYPTITNCTFIGNSAAKGGGMYIISPPTAVTHCAFIENTAAVNGGGLYNSGYASTTYTNCTFIGNSAGNDGGGIYNQVNYATFTNCVITGNMASVDGGGVCNYDRCGTTFTNCTFSGNSATFGSGGGMYNDNGFGPSNPQVTNCIFWGDFPDEIANNDSYPLVYYSDVEGGWPGDTNIDADPLFVSFHGFEYLLGRGSPCIDAGNPYIEDGRSWPMWYNNGLRSDMGAYGGPENVGWLQ
jgi:parallel beta-helix repeat protein/predicted outer membrane repeat protein